MLEREFLFEFNDWEEVLQNPECLVILIRIWDVNNIVLLVLWQPVSWDLLVLLKRELGFLVGFPHSRLKQVNLRQFQLQSVKKEQNSFSLFFVQDCFEENSPHLSLKIQSILEENFSEGIGIPFCVLLNLIQGLHQLDNARQHLFEEDFLEYLFLVEFQEGVALEQCHLNIFSELKVVVQVELALNCSPRGFEQLNHESEESVVLHPVDCFIENEK